LVVLLQLRACAFGLWDGGSDAVWVLCGVGFFGFGICRFDACSIVGQYSVRMVASRRSSCQRCVGPLQSEEAITTITETITYRCTRCQSTNIVRNGRNASGNPKFLCKECGASRALTPKVRYTDEQKQLILRAYHERSRLRGVQRLFGGSRPTLIAWIKKSP